MFIKQYERLNDLFIKNHTKESLNYLHKRGFIDETIKKFKLGYNDNMDLCNATQFDNCVTIPYYDMHGRIIAFYFRSMAKNPAQKHNSTFNIQFIYEKSRCLYNLGRVLKNYYNGTVFVVEGLLDCVSMWQAGLKNTVSSMHNTFSSYQLEMLYRYFNKIYLIEDNDEPGKNMTESFIDFENKQFNKKRKQLTLYRVKIDIDDCKDINDMLINGYNIKKYIKKHRQLIS